MSPRRQQLHPVRRAALLAALKAHGDLEEQARLDKYVQIAVANAEGIPLREIAEVFNVSRDTAQRWKDAGEREQERRAIADGSA